MPIKNPLEVDLETLDFNIKFGIDLNKDCKVDNSELKVAKDRLQYLEKKCKRWIPNLQNSINGVTEGSNKVDNALKEIKKLNSLISSSKDI